MSSLPRPNTSQGWKTPETHVIEEDASFNEGKLVSDLLARFSSPQYKPPQAPKVALELAAMAARPNVEPHEVAKLLEQDPMIGGQVLKLANSAAYGGRSPIKTLKDAAVRLGLQAMRNIVLEAALNMRVFRADGYSGIMEQLRVHSSATANAARIIGRYTSMDAEFAFACGLLHDVGLAASLILLGDTAPRQKPPPISEVWNAMERVHEEAGGILMALWAVPGDMNLVIRTHHQARVGGVIHPHVAILALAEELAAENGAGIDIVKASATGGKPVALAVSGSVLEGKPTIPREVAFKALRLDDRLWGLVVKDFQAFLSPPAAGR